MTAEPELKVLPPDFNRFLWDLHQLLKPMVERRLQEKYRRKHGVEWWKGVMESERFGKRYVGSDFLSNPEHVLDIVSRFFELFEPVLQSNGRALIADLRNARNWISHTEISVSTALHITDSFLTVFNRLGQNAPEVVAKKAELEELLLKDMLAKHKAKTEEPSPSAHSSVETQSQNARRESSDNQNDSPSTSSQAAPRTELERSSNETPQPEGPGKPPAAPTRAVASTDLTGSVTAFSPGIKTISAAVAMIAVVATVAVIWPSHDGNNRGAAYQATREDASTQQDGGKSPPIQSSPTTSQSSVETADAAVPDVIAPQRGSRSRDVGAAASQNTAPVARTTQQSERYLTAAKTEGTLFVFAPDTNPAIEVDLTSAFQGTSGVFAPAFFRDGLFDRVYQGDLVVLNGLGLADTAVLYACRASEKRTKSEALDPDLKRSEVQLTCRRLVPASRTSRLVDVTGVGAGYSDDAAFRVGVEHAVQAFKSKLQERQ
jgi:hypothetical protein